MATNPSKESPSAAAERAAAEAAAAAEKAERERKDRINKQINEKSNKVTSYSNIVSELQSEKSDMEVSIQKWVTAKNNFNKVNIAKDVVIKNVFEGTAAKSVKEDNKSKIQKMDAKITSASSIKDSIGSQESTVNNKISSLNTEISNLRSQL